VARPLLAAGVALAAEAEVGSAAAFEFVVSTTSLLEALPVKYGAVTH
jgi:hypothetical protein